MPLKIDAPDGVLAIEGIDPDPLTESLVAEPETEDAEPLTEAKEGKLMMLSSSQRHRRRFG